MFIKEAGISSIILKQMITIINYILCPLLTITKIRE
jgi:hypothetical protein